MSKVSGSWRRLARRYSTSSMGGRSGHNAPNLARQVLCLRANFIANQNASSWPIGP